MSPENVEKLVSYWKCGAEDDLKSAIDIANQTTHLVQAMFFLHLATEKVLKALFVKINGTHAPLTHNLLFLIGQCDLQIDEQQRDLLTKVNEFNLECRYPDEILSLKEKIDKTCADNYLQKVQEFHVWIFQKLNQ